jgi:hypothetical protein
MSSWDTSLDMLKKELSYLYGRESDYRAFVREVGLEEQSITFIGKARTDWSNILEEARKKRMLMDMIEKGRREWPNRFVLRVVECYVKHNGGSHKKVWPAKLSESAREMFEYHSRLQQIMQILICWNDTLAMIRKTIPSFSILPEDYVCIQSLMGQLEVSFQKVHQLFANSDVSRTAFETEYYEFIRNLVVTEQQMNEVITKIQEFQDGYSKSSIVSFELEEYIQQELAEIVQNLGEADGWMSKWQHQFLEGEISSDEETNDTEKVYSSIEVTSDPANIGRRTDSHQMDRSPASNATVTEAISDPVTIDPKQVTRDLLHQALFRFYNSDSTGFTNLCSVLATKFKDIKVRKSNLGGNKLEGKITSLLDYCEDKGLYNDLVQYLISSVSGFLEILKEM